MGGGAYESDLLNLREQAMRHRGLASNRLFRMPTFLPKIDESTSPREPADDAKQAAHRLHRSVIKMYPVSRRVNNVRNDGPDLVEPISDDDVAADGRPTRDAPDPRTPGLFDDEANAP